MSSILSLLNSIICIISILFSSVFLPAESGLQWKKDNITVYSSVNGAYYPRIIKLDNGTLLCGFTTSDNLSKTAVKVLASNDGGNSWSDELVIASCNPEYNCDNANFIQLENGDLLLAYRAVLTHNDKTYTSLRTSVSHDNGKTWSAHSLIVEYTNQLFKGVWEPHLFFIGDTLAVFYANDSLINNGDLKDWQQNIEYRLFENGAWSEKHIVSSGVETNSRDGMPVLCRLLDGSYALVVEGTKSTSLKNIKNGMFIKLMISKDGLNWDAQKAINIYYPEDSSRSAGAPGITCLPDGRIAVSFQTDEDCAGVGSIPEGKGYTMKVMVSSRPVTSLTKRIVFSSPEEPFEMPDDKYALWSAVFCIDNELIAATCTNLNGNSILLKKADI